MDDDTRRLIDDLNDGDKILVVLVDYPDVNGEFVRLHREECGSWEVVVMRYRKGVSEFVYLPTERIAHIMLRKRTSSS